LHPQTTNPPALETVISLTHTYLDLDETHGTPDEFLPWLASWVALTLQDNWPTRTKRQFIREIASLYRQRGTKASLQKILQIYLASAGFEAVSQKAQIAEFPNHPHFFQVTLNLPVPDPELYQSQARIARTIIDQEKPAHTYYALQILLPTMQVSGQVFPLKLSEPGTITATLENVQASGENPPSPLLALKIKSGAPQPEVCAQRTISDEGPGTVAHEVSVEEFGQYDTWFVSVANLSSVSITARLEIQFPSSETGQNHSLSLSPGLKIGRPPDGNTVLGNESTSSTER
jgi:phage tail-like protein